LAFALSGDRLLQDKGNVLFFVPRKKLHIKRPLPLATVLLFFSVPVPGL
jgi:hypothetical protein